MTEEYYNIHIFIIQKLKQEIMAESNSDKNKKNDNNPYKKTVNKWVVWTAIAVVVFVILLLIFNRRSTVVNEEAESDSPIAFITAQKSILSSQIYLT